MVGNILKYTLLKYILLKSYCKRKAICINYAIIYQLYYYSIIGTYAINQSTQKNKCEGIFLF